MAETTTEALFNVAHSIAHRHTKRGWFESETSRLVRAIKLRSAIYDELVTIAHASRRALSEGGE